MKSEDVKKAVAYGGKTMKEVSLEIGQTPTNVQNKLKRESLKDADLEKIAEAVGAKYYAYIEFPDGVQIGTHK